MCVCLTSAAAAGGGDASSLYLGLDFGTSGARACMIDSSGTITFESKRPYGPSASDDWAAAWEAALWALLDSLPADARARTAAVAFDGTSATAMLVDAATGRQLAPPLLYCDAMAAEAVAAVRGYAPEVCSSPWRRLFQLPVAYLSTTIYY